MSSTRRCGHCHEAGHDRRTCPAPEQIERRLHAREARLAAIRVEVEEAHAHRAQELARYVVIKVGNNNSYPVNVFWYKTGSHHAKALGSIGAQSVLSFKALPEHSMIAIPQAEFGTDRFPRAVSFDNEIVYYKGRVLTVVGNFAFSEFTNQTIQIAHEYCPPKTELDQWKECGLKSLYLLKELERMGAKKYDNLEPIIDLVQDIVIPQCTEYDKEMAGVPSAFTNIT